ncbi:Oidioi.mRNA.OKI2018_I69.XSR.g16083.t1.cds [Oikopleura dioica]|uniref:Oidioi.mRNA.OKI2018_I69.XSR.g16083.t1.cds n=1 Tax=Oikopleura dioica TaxID=34765 RepID=A0ABN7SJW5_OIKDI|nr:Oidioi.mRNA.OKI2018_I69.XSR.g16083.t1.cds [Oikopleura dioica]
MDFWIFLAFIASVSASGGSCCEDPNPPYMDKKKDILTRVESLAKEDLPGFEVCFSNMLETKIEEDEKYRNFLIENEDWYQLDYEEEHNNFIMTDERKNEMKETCLEMLYALKDLACFQSQHGPVDWDSL